MSEDLHLYKMSMVNSIQKFLNNYVNVQYIYGILTDGEISDTNLENIKTNIHDQYDDSWNYMYVTKYSLVKNNSIDNRENINELQKYFIGRLITLFNTKCVNNEQDLRNQINFEENSVYFYIFYKIYNPDD